MMIPEPNMTSKDISLRSERSLKVLSIIASVLTILIVGYVDYITGEEISLALFYLIPISAATWLLTRWVGITLALLSAALELFIHYLAQPDSIQTFHILNSAGDLFFFSFFVIILSILKKQYYHEKKAAGTDPLTRVMNLRAFNTFSTSEIERSYRYKHVFSVAYMDIDNFKEVNDTFGHAVGDDVLKVVAITMQEFVRSTDVVARVGGDEFVIFLPETDADAAKTVMNKIHDILNRVMKRNEWPVTFSIGAITFLDAPRDFDEMMKKTDHLMYDAKKEGKNMLKHETYKSQW